MWIAYEPDPSDRYLAMQRGRWRIDACGDEYKPEFPRRWKTAEAAMRTVDKEFPLTPVPTSAKVIS